MRYRFGWRDGFMLAFLLAAASAAVVCLVCGAADAVYFPTLAFAEQSPLFCWGLAAYGAYSLLPVLINVKEALAWRILLSRM